MKTKHILGIAAAVAAISAFNAATADSGTGGSPVETPTAPAAVAAPAAAPERETEVFAQSGTEVPHSKTRPDASGRGVEANIERTGEPPVPLSAAAAALQRHRAYERDRAAVRERHDAANGRGDLYNKWLDAPAQDERRKQFFRDILLFAEDAADPGLAVRLAHEYEEHHLAPGRPIEGAPTKAELVALYKKHDRLHYLRHHSTKEEILALPKEETWRALDLIRDKRLGLSEEEVAAHTDDFRRRQVHTGELDRHYIAWARKRLAAMVTPVAVEWVEKEVKSHAALDLEYRNRKAVVTNWLATLQLLRELAGLESAPAAQRDTGGSPVSLAPGVSAPPSLTAAAAAKAAPLRDAGLTQEPPPPAKYSALWFARDRADKDGTDAALTRYYRLAAATEATAVSAAAAGGFGVRQTSAALGSGTNDIRQTKAASPPAVKPLRATTSPRPIKGSGVPSATAAPQSGRGLPHSKAASPLQETEHPSAANS